MNIIRKVYERAVNWSKYIGLFIVVFSVSCLGKNSDIDYVYNPPGQLNDGWQVSTLQENGLDSGIIIELSDKIIDDHYKGINSLLIIRNDALLFEGYYNGFDREDRRRLYSVTKSVSSALIGIAIDKDYIEDVNIYISPFFPCCIDLDWSNSRDEITLKHMLTMTSGLEWEELAYPYSDYRNSHNQMGRSDNWFRFTLSRSMAHEPGTRFAYSTGTSNLLAGAIRYTSGRNIDDFARTHLFEPLGIDSYSWVDDPQGNPCAGGSNGGLSLRPRDLAKFGYLYLNAGRWQGTQIVAEEWIAESISNQLPDDHGFSYGYQWWMRYFEYKNSTVGSFFAMGYGGQYVFIIPTLDMEIIVTSSNYGERFAYAQVYEMVEDFVLKAVN
ncbi:MAG: serine hydrolase [candidate division Zixibacteria bacterium]|nr:serine hydrolase [candidate division Zixibacteria bacterium]